ncbi:MAG: acyl-CoA dehydrogenase [Acidobacteriota bacterium]
MIDFSLTAEQKMLRDSIRDFAVSEILPGVKKREEKGEFPADVVRALGKIGVCGMTIPDEWGGAGADTLTYCLAIEEIARICPSTAITVSVNNSVCCYPIWKFGTEDQKRRYLLPCAQGKILGGFCLTEPQAGSDAANQKTRAVIDGNHYVLTGQKAWITNAGQASIYVVMAVTDPALGSKGISAFIVEAGWPGVVVGRYEDKMGLRASTTATLTFDGVRVPRENLLGAEGQGLHVALHSLDAGRIGVAAQAVGIGQSALDEALAYARSRTTFGKPIHEHQAVGFMLAEMSTEVEAGRQLTYRAATLRDQGKPFAKEASMAKLYASEMCNRVAYQAVQVHGGYGYSKEYAVERICRDARVVTVYEGTSEIQRMVIARHLLS